ncbi:SDR family NAD(P)-dependent oxidoreductase [Conexibacter sp. JD483]|uniref:SDR family NAD(P)-dependent oxidoreductase n=1 Tax=unclassified Conexibacter TaxID=2627773 RepID=UPI002716C88F|nr:MULTISPECIES: SDR family NAD(P)-dependent oxidoreductase [unclassified Conexibacter]MDO8188182.1 SDR family NAD(P)-dependent oxidoreductase [Conexibacter sp. CPCC 205706]MDO8201589.1 SDR family NAD(P)-dependent oxidoreductase [Conexibacter sp. CPCC 205762]MDR9372371.1 SDR family NAD(P)-dependent oxidoreductase [Conexibacter sp. JD483]
MADLLDLSGRTLIVTGAAAGLGRATAATVAQAGARVVLSDLPGEPLDAAVAELRAAGAEALARPARIGDRDEVRALVADTVADGGLHGVVACAGIAGTRPFAELPREEWDAVVNVNATGMFDLVQAAGAALPEGGAMVLFSSVAGRGGRADAPHYAASKAAVISLARSAALAFGPAGVRVNAICPGVIFTRMWEERIEGLDRELGAGAGQRYLDELTERMALKRLGTPQEIANATLFLLSDAAAYVTGQALNVCGGLEFD